MCGSPAGAAVAVGALNNGPFTFDLDFLNDGAGYVTVCGTHASPAVRARCRAVMKTLFFDRSFAQAQRFVVARGDAVLKPLVEWFKDESTFEDVRVRSVDVTGQVLATLRILVPDGSLAAEGQGFAAERRLVYLSAPASDGKPAWDAAFFVTSLWHPSTRSTRP